MCYTLIMQSKRIINLDIIRCLALLLVMTVHISSHSIKLDNPKAFIHILIETIAMSCVPLFIMLTGFLMNSSKTKLNDKNHYIRLFSRILIPYFIVGVLVVLFKKYALGEEIDVIKGALFILSFPEYFWYINMYIGLYLLYPILNIIWNNLKSKQEIHILLAILIFLTIAPSLTNIYNLTDINWWKNLGLSYTYNPILPNWWVMIYPITYYFIGAYISRYKSAIEKISWKKYAIALIISSILFALYNFWRSHGSTMVLGQWFEYYGFEHSIKAFLIFCLILTIKIDKIPIAWRKIIIKVSDLSFGAYMMSWLVDNIVHPHIPNDLSRVKYIPAALILIFILSTLLSYILEKIMKPVISKIEPK